MIEPKTTTEIFQNHREVMKDTTMFHYLESSKTKWIQLFELQKGWIDKRRFILLELKNKLSYNLNKIDGQLDCLDLLEWEVKGMRKETDSEPMLNSSKSASNSSQVSSPDVCQCVGEIPVCFCNVCHKCGKPLNRVPNNNEVKR